MHLQLVDHTEHPDRSNFMPTILHVIKHLTSPYLFALSSPFYYLINPGYVGDMLAWLHQMTPTERENAQALLKGCDKSGKI